ncbi:MAG: GNAT family N-acetyltransferase, partial [Chitinophagales bacterium]
WRFGGMEFKEVNPDMFDECLSIIRESFKTVADEFHLTKENAPTNPAFIGLDVLIGMYEKKIVMFAVMDNQKYIGFVAIERANDKTYYMEKLAVIPEYRHKGYGKAIMDFVVNHVKEKEGIKISIGIINENTVLKSWYLNYGFVEYETKVFGHLPFTVCLMEKTI